MAQVKQQPQKIQVPVGPRTYKKASEDDFDEDAKRARKELIQVAQNIDNDGNLKIKQSVVGKTSVEFFRGVNFHIQVLKYREDILSMLPTVKEELGNNLETIKDSIALGNLFLKYKLLIVLDKHPNLIIPAEDKGKVLKHPKAMVIMPDPKTITETGFYMWQMPSQNAKQAMILAGIVALMIFFLCFRLWPLWLKKAIFYFSFYTLCAIAVTTVVRLVLYILLFHIGFDFWLFPNFFIDSNDILDSFRPIYSLEKRDDMTDPKMIIIRIASFGFICMTVMEIAKDPDSLKFTLQEGFDIFDEFERYGQGMFLGNDADKKMKVEEDEEPEKKSYREKSTREIFEEAMLEDEEEEVDIFENLEDYVVDDPDDGIVVDFDSLFDDEEDEDEEESKHEDL